MRYRRILLLVLLGMAGCAGARQPASSGAVSVTQGPPPAVTTRPSPAIAGLALDQIKPVPSLRPAPIARRPGPPPVEAVRLFAHARIALLDADRARAAALLRQAIVLDPASFDLHKALGDLDAASDDPRALDEWNRAAAIEPDHLALQVAIGRRYMSRADLGHAIEHLRLALQTGEYRRDGAGAAQADFLLARALEQKGYDRAALQVYGRLMSLLASPTMPLRRDPQVAILLSHPAVLALNIAALYEKHGSYKAAIELLSPVAAARPADFDVRARIVRDRLAMGNRRQALRGAADLVRVFDASRPSLSLLRETAGSDAAAADVLETLHRAHAQDRPILYALIDELIAGSRTDDARRLIAAAMKQLPEDLRLLRRQITLFRAQKDLTSAAKALIEALALRPDSELEIAPIWESLARPSSAGRLREDQVRKLAVSAQAAPARLVLLARLARMYGRSALEHDALGRAVAARPVFPPAWRESMNAIWADSAHSAAQKQQASQELADASAGAGNPMLMAELLGEAALNNQSPGAAATAFAQAVRAADRSPELYLGFAAALDLAGDDVGAESLLAKLIKQHPFCDDAYVEFHAICLRRRQTSRADQVLDTWLANDPDSAAARRLEAAAQIQRRHYAEAQRILLDLLDHHDSDPQVLAAVYAFYSETARLGPLATMLEQRFTREPWNFSLGELLSETYQQQHRPAEASRVAGQLRTAAAGDADLRYELSALYTRLALQPQSEQVLRQVLKLDPTHAGANNDLGYFWAERGTNLPRAEALVGNALRAEPDNPAFLDSMGWVLYKRGRFEQALACLKRAAGPSDEADPQVLDHLGDTLYRLGDRRQAAAKWQDAVRRLGNQNEEGGDQTKALRALLLQKQQDLNAGRAVTVAPIGVQAVGGGK